MVFSKDAGVVEPVPLSVAPRRHDYRIDRVSGPDQRRLCELGLIEGAGIQVVNRGGRNMIVVKVGGSRLALARGTVDHVWVR